MSILYRDLLAKYYNGNPPRETQTQFRLEGRSRDPDNEANLLMRVADPLWLLGRQWQFGEFVGEDNGSPVGAQVKYRSDKFDYFRSKDKGTFHPTYRSKKKDDKDQGVPLETQVEAMQWPLTDLKQQIRASQQLFRLIRRYIKDPALQKSYFDQLLEDFPLTLQDEKVDKKPSIFLL